MTIRNSFNTISKKFEVIWNNVNKNSFSVTNQVLRQGAIKNTLDTGKVRNSKNNIIEDLSGDWEEFDVGTFDEDYQITTEIYKTWEVEVIGLKYDQLSALKHKFEFKFGEDGEILENIKGSTNVETTECVLPDLISDTCRKFTYYYGIMMRVSDSYISSHVGIPAIDQYAIKVKLKLDLFNPNTYD